MTYELIEAAVRRANPVPEPSGLPSGAAPPRIFQEGIHVELLEHDHPVDEALHRAPDRRAPRWGPVALAAAAVVAAFLVGLVVADREPQPTAPADSVAPPETFDTVPALEPVLLTPAMEFLGTPLPLGDYRIDLDRDPATTISATLTTGGERWWPYTAGVLRDKPGTTDAYSIALMVAQVDRVNDAGCTTQRFVSQRGGDVRQWTEVGRGVQELADALAGMQGVVIYEPVTPTSAFGYPAYHMSIGIPDCPGEPYRAWDGPTFERYYYAGTAELWVLDVNGTAVLVEAVWHADTTAEDRNALWSAIGTLEITP